MTKDQKGFQTRPRYLTFEEREIISRELALGKTLNAIAKSIQRGASTISDEVRNNGGRDNYRAVAAQQRYESTKNRPKERKLEQNTRLHDHVNDKLALKWSPSKISRRLHIDFPDDSDMRVSHETIYQCLFLQAKGELKTHLKLCLRQGRYQRRTQTRAATTQGKIKDMVMISERPAEVEDRAIPGHWEGDLIIGKGGKSQIATLVERSTRFLILVRIPYDRTTGRVVSRISTEMSKLPEHLKRSLTWDQGKELADHITFKTKTGMPVYFCDPHSPWQRGTNENTNGLLRQYYPKGTDLSGYTQEELNRVADELNDRPRDTLGGYKPIEKFTELITRHAQTPPAGP